VQALIDNLIERGLDTKVCRLFIVDGAKALSKVIRRTFGAHTPPELPEGLLHGLELGNGKGNVPALVGGG
jgi:hypothetical protein